MDLLVMRLFPYILSQDERPREGERNSLATWLDAMSIWFGASLSSLAFFVQHSSAIRVKGNRRFAVRFLFVNCTQSSIRPTMWNWKAHSAGNWYRQILSLDEWRNCIVLENSWDSRGRLACDGFPCLRTYFFFTALMRLLTGTDLVGFPLCIIAFQVESRFGIKYDNAFL